MIIDIWKNESGLYLWGETGKGADPDCQPQRGTGRATLDAIEKLENRGVDLDAVQFGGRADRLILIRYGLRRVSRRVEARNHERRQHGGARPGAGRPRRETPPASITIRVEPEIKEAFDRAAERSKEGNLTRWLIAAGKEKIERSKRN